MKWCHIIITLALATALFAQGPAPARPNPLWFDFGTGFYSGRATGGGFCANAGLWMRDPTALLGLQAVYNEDFSLYSDSHVALTECNALVGKAVDNRFVRLYAAAGLGMVLADNTGVAGSEFEPFFMAVPVELGVDLIALKYVGLGLHLHAVYSAEGSWAGFSFTFPIGLLRN